MTAASPPSIAMLADADRFILRAATLRDDGALPAFRAWRATVALDDLTPAAHRSMPLLLDLVRRHGIEDPDLARMKGVGRHIWTSNVLQLRQLFAALDALDAAGVPAVLLKGAALFARDPDSAAKRLSSDYDLLVPPEALDRARAALRPAGFMPKGLDWQDFDETLVDSIIAGAPLQRAGQHGELDLHWRPLPGIDDPTLTTEILAAAEPATLQGRSVRIPGAAHHLFLAMARCEPWDKDECFGRLMEGHFLLARARAPVDWGAFEALVARYGFAAHASDYLSVLASETGLGLPPEVLRRLAAAQAPADGEEWALRALSPSDRTPAQLRRLAARDLALGRTRPVTTPLQGRAEALIAGLDGLPFRLAAIWHLASRRFSGPSTGRPRFLGGFSYPEADGRWTLGRWAFLAVPLDEAQRRGAPLRLKVHAFRGTRARTRVVATAGAGTVRTTLTGGNVWPRLALRARPLPRLGGDALVALWLPDAMSPDEAGLSRDRRQLCLFVHRDWRG